MTKEKVQSNIEELNEFLQDDSLDFDYDKWGSIILHIQGLEIQNGKLQKDNNYLQEHYDSMVDAILSKNSTITWYKKEYNNQKCTIDLLISQLDRCPMCRGYRSEDGSGIVHKMDCELKEKK